MDYGVLIDNHLELIRFDQNHNIYISRKSLKHFAESRKKEMFDTHTEYEIFDKLYFAIDNTINTYILYDECVLKDLNRIIYVKYFDDLTQHSLRIVVEMVENRLEICSIHFQKRKKPPQGSFLIRLRMTAVHSHVVSSISTLIFLSSPQLSRLVIFCR